MRFLRLLALPAVVAGLLVFGATYDVPGPPPPPLSAGELAWVAGLRAWLATPLPGRCTAPLAAAPSGRLDDVRGDFEAACRERGPAAALERSRAARVRLAAELRDRRPLPTSGALVATSRVEPRLGAASSALAGGRRVEVRCWSQADWRAVLAEEQALAGVGAGRPWLWLPRERSLQLQGVHCGPLVRLARAGVPATRAGRTDLALALWTATAAAESFSARPCLRPAEVAIALGASGREAVELVARARTELAPVLPPPGRRCAASRRSV